MQHKTSPHGISFQKCAFETIIAIGCRRGHKIAISRRGGQKQEDKCVVTSHDMLQSPILNRRELLFPSFSLPSHSVFILLSPSLAFSFLNPCVFFRIEWLSKTSEMSKRDGREEPAPSDTRAIKAHNNTAGIGKWGCLLFLIALETVCTPRWIEKEWTEWRLTLRARVSRAFAVMKIKDGCDEKERAGREYFLEIDPTSGKFRNSRKKHGLWNWKRAYFQNIVVKFAYCITRQ